MIVQFSDSPSVNWTLLVVKHPKKTPESRVRLPTQTAVKSFLQFQEWGRLLMFCSIWKVILPFLSRPSHMCTHTQSLQLGGVPTWAASKSKKKTRFQCCQRCIMGKTSQDTTRDKQMRWCSWCSIPSATPDGLNWKSLFLQPANWCSFDFFDGKSISPKRGKQHSGQRPELSPAENQTHPSAFTTQWEKKQKPHWHGPYHTINFFFFFFNFRCPFIILTIVYTICIFFSLLNWNSEPESDL